MSLENDMVEDKTDKNEVQNMYGKYIIIDARGVEIKVAYEQAIQIPLFKAKIERWNHTKDEIIGKFYVNFHSDAVHKLLDGLNKKSLDDYFLMENDKLTFKDIFSVQSGKVTVHPSYEEEIFKTIVCNPPQIYFNRSSCCVDTVVLISMNGKTRKFLIHPFTKDYDDDGKSNGYYDYFYASIECFPYKITKCICCDEMSRTLTRIIYAIWLDIEFLKLFYDDVC